VFLKLCPSDMSQPMTWLSVCMYVLASTAVLTQGSRPYRLCGDALTNMLEFVCYGGDTENGFNIAKRKEQFTADKMLPGVEVKLLESSSRSKRGKRGVVDECCYTACTLSTLVTYCASPGDKEVRPSPQVLRQMLGYNTAYRPMSSGAVDLQTIIATPTATPRPSMQINRGSAPRHRYNSYVYLPDLLQYRQPTRRPLE